MALRSRLLAVSLAALAVVGTLSAWRAPAHAADPVAPATAAAPAEQPVSARPADAPPMVTTGKDCAPTKGTKATPFCLNAGSANESLAVTTSVVPKPWPNSVHLNMPWCDSRISTGYNRFEACLKYQVLLVEVFSLPSMQLVGTAEFAFEQRMRTYQLVTDVTLSARFVPIRVDASIEPVTLNYDPKCVGPCTQYQPLQWGDLSWTAGDLHVAEISSGWYWNRAGQAGAQDTLDLTQSISFTSPRGIGVSTSADFADREATVRCDRQYANTEGCVLYKQRPTYTIDKNAYPAAYYFIGWTQANMGGMGTPRGADGKDHPLHREADQKTSEGQREKICPSGWVKNEDTIAATLAADPTDGAQCDEFPFAASEESGTDIYGNKVANGDGCDQFYAYAAVRFPGKWSFGLDWRLGYPMPRPTARYAPCGRASMPGKQNGGVGSELRTFHGRQRVLDGDAYYVESGGQPFRLPAAALTSGELRLMVPGNVQCLTAVEGPVSAVIGLSLAGCDRRDLQQWEVRRVTSGVYEIKDRKYGQCLTAEAGGTDASAAPCTGAAEQLWRTTASHINDWGFTGFEVRNTATSTCLGPKDGKVEFGSSVVLRTCADTPDQNWF